MTKQLRSARLSFDKTERFTFQYLHTMNDSSPQFFIVMFSFCSILLGVEYHILIIFCYLNKAGCPPTRKPSEHKTYTRQKKIPLMWLQIFLVVALKSLKTYAIVFIVIIYFGFIFPSFYIHFLFYLLVGSDDGHEELLAAANATVNPGTCLTNVCIQLLLYLN